MVAVLKKEYFLCRGVPPAPRSDHTATVQAGRYFLVFGGGSHSTCFNDLNVLDLDSVSSDCNTQ